MSWVRSAPDGARLAIRVVPRADHDAIRGVQGETLKIRLCAPPVDNQANEALVRFLAEALDWPRRRIRLVAGARGRLKEVEVAGLAPEQVTARLKLERN